MTWRVADALETLLDEANAHAPNRSIASDGGIGDAAHATRDSDHNPWVVVNGVGIVRARDFTHDPDGGLDCQKLAVALAELMDTGTHPALGSGAYIIWRRRILSRDRMGEGWRTYAGSNTHEKHLHLSVALDRRGFDSTRPWGVFKEDDMFGDEDRRLLRAIAEQQDADQKTLRVVLKRLGTEGAIRTKLNRLIEQGKATRGELEDLASDLDTLADTKEGR